MKAGKRKKLSIVIPTYNEEKNILGLCKAIDEVLTKHRICYEIVFVDDHSSDRTLEQIRLAALSLPIRFFLKKGKKGKAFSLLEGFRKTRYPLIAMIDADLQYAPSSLPKMVTELEKGSDVVVANRIHARVLALRLLVTHIFKYLFVRLLFGEKVDAQSGMKVFRKHILSRLELHPTPWSFDLEFLIKAKEAGFRIASIDTIFRKRRKGKTKVSLLASSLELAWSAVRLKLGGPHISVAQRSRHRSFSFKGTTFVPHSSLRSSQTALYLFRTWHSLVFLFIVSLVTICFLINWHITLVTIISAITFLYLLDLGFNLGIIYRSFSKAPEVISSRKALFSRTMWPTYTIMCPLYKEWRVVPQFVRAIEALDYPKDKLQVLFLLEQHDKATIQQVRQERLPASFQTVIVPNSKPKTKPKALNYGLLSATGEHIVVYDAEDIPDPHQLKKAVLAFEKAKKEVVCVQAKLNFYNPHQNILTRLFAAEYSLWFDLVLTGLQSIHAPIPLGGTSNHFRRQQILSLGGWDSFNVTEDADLGMRLAKKGFKTVLIDSYTMEEANSQIGNWFRQRSRWIKGYIQTYIVHMRDPMAFIHDWKKPHTISFQIIVGGKVLSMLINPIMWLTTFSYFAFRGSVGPFIESIFPGPVFYLAVISLLCGNFLYIYYYMLGIARRNEWSLIPFALLTPLYWLLMSAAAFYALWEIMYRPHYWHKTKHGLHLSRQQGESQTIADTRKKRLAFLPA